MHQFVLMVAAVFAVSAAKPAPTTEQQVLTAEQEWVDATLAGDVDRFASFIGDEYVALVQNGQTFDKSTWVSDLRAARVKYESVKLSNLVAHVYGHTAVVRGEFAQRATGNHPTTSGRYVNTWVKRNGRWQIVASGFSDFPASVPADKKTGYVLQPDEGEPLLLCTAPNLRVNIKASPATTAVPGFAVGTAEVVTGSNYGTHKDQDEVNYFVAGEGIGTIGATEFPIRPGTTMYVPRGVRHGFRNTGATPLMFVWAISPAGLEEHFRAAGRPPGIDCPPAKK